MNEFIVEFPSIRFCNEASRFNDNIIKEERVTFFLNNKKLISTMSLPNDQDAQAVGFLMSEGVIESIDNIKNITISSDGLKVYIDAFINEDNINNLYHEKTLTSGCCVGVSANFEGKIVEKFISSKITYRIHELSEFIKKFEESSELFSLTGCVHKVMLFCGDIIFSSEDIGRHNALDKAIGKARLSKVDISDSVLIVSGRLSMEMVIKCAMHNIPMVISKSATTALGIKSASKLGITLIGFARNNAMNIYTHPSRILDINGL